MPAAGLLAVGFLALVTRGMHLDGLADTADGLGCYGPPERALAVMRDGGVGAFAVVALVVASGRRPRRSPRSAHVPPSRSRRRRWPRRRAGAGFAWCRAPRGARRPAGRARRDRGGSQPSWVAVAVVGGAGAAGVAALPGRPAGPLAVGPWRRRVVVALSAHTARRFGGMTGDVLGAANELAVTAALVVLAAR